MADTNKSLPVLTYSDGDVVAKIGDGSTPSQQLAVNASGHASTVLEDVGATQTTDLKITLDGEDVDLAVGAKVIITDGTDDLAVNADGTINVNIVSAQVTGEVHDYDTAAAVVKDASSTHTYTVTGGTTLMLKQILASASGLFRAEVKTGPSGSTATVAVFFGSGVGGPPVIWTLPTPIEVVATNVVEVVRTNRDNQTQDLYSTIIGEEI